MWKQWDHGKDSAPLRHGPLLEYSSLFIDTWLLKGWGRWASRKSSYDFGMYSFYA